MSPTVFRHGGFRYFFFSREESRMHVHALGSDGEAKVWPEPSIELARSEGLNASQAREIVRIVEERADEIRAAWHRHFSS